MRTRALAGAASFGLSRRGSSRGGLALLGAALLASACGSGSAPVVDGNAHPPPAPSAGQVCNDDRWCWFGPLPQGALIRSLWGTAWNDIWAAGDSLLHFDGAGWSRAASPLRLGDQLRVVWGSSATDVWAAGDALLHWDGNAWTRQSGLPDGVEFIALAGSGPKDVWVVSDSGDGPAERQSILHFDGAAWTVQLGPVAPDLRALWSSGPGRAWVAGFDVNNLASRTLRLQGGSWSEVPTTGAYGLKAIWGTSETDVWTAGGSLVLHWDGSGWSAVAGVPVTAALSALWGLGPANVYAGGEGGLLHFDGTGWSSGWTRSKEDSRELRAIWGSGPKSVWAGGDLGLQVHGDGASFAEYSQGTGWFLEAATAISATDAWAVGGNGTALHFDGQRWSDTTTPIAEPLEAVWASSATDVWAAGASGDCTGFILRWNGSAWSTSFAESSGYCFNGLSGSGAADIWAVATNALLHWNGAGWEPAGPPDASASVWAASAASVWVLQDSTQGGLNAPGGVYHYDGSTWSLQQTAATGTLRRLWGSGAHDVWAVGDEGGALQHWNGSAWSAVASGLEDGSLGLDAIWGSGPADAWAGSRNSAVLLHWDGLSWKAQQASAGWQGVTALAGSATSDVWAVSGNGTLLHHGR